LWTYGTAAADAGIRVRFNVIPTFVEASARESRVDGVVSGGPALAWICLGPGEPIH